jgi:predicted RNA-binding protein with PIN domain
VFDAAHAPPGLSHELDHRGLKVRFSRRGGTADELLEEMIAAEPDPRHLLVVSSDHSDQRAARQRGAELVRATKSSDSRQGPSAAGKSEKELVQMPNPFPPGFASDVLEDPEA